MIPPEETKITTVTSTLWAGRTPHVQLRASKEFIYTQRDVGAAVSSSPDDTTRLVDADSPAVEPDLPLPDWEEYRIESVLGEGGMARVYKAFEPKLQRYVALKFIRSDDENVRRRLLREARAQAQIEHDHVCKIYEVGEVQGRPYIAMQLIQGGTLQDLAKEMSLDQKILLMERVADAVQAAHRLGLVHRDIKPSNIMIERREDGTYRPFVMDFGIARDLSDAGATATGLMMGTPAFMAPEQALGDSRAIDRRTDIFSLGATIYYVVSGQRPFPGTGMEVLIKVVSDDPPPLKKLVPSLPEDIDIIVSKCLEKEPIRRYESARALADDLKRYLEGEPISAHRATLGYRAVKKIRKHKTVAAIIAAASIIFLASAGFSMFSYLRASRQVDVARELSQSVEAMDWTMRVAVMAPLHDIRKERELVQKRMQDIDRLMKASGSAGQGPGNYALGRGCMALQDYEQARRYLEKAWNSDYRGKEVAGALGLTLGALYKSKLSEIDRISDPAARKQRLDQVEKEFRDPAVQYLKAGSDPGNASHEYGEALLSYCEKRWDDALRLARVSGQKTPWLYEAWMLEGDVYSRQGEQAYHDGDFQTARKHFESGMKSYAVALDNARSDPALFESQCSLWRSVMEVDFAVDRDAAGSFESSNAACNKALVANPDSANAYGLLAQTAWRWGESQFEAGSNPSEQFHTAIAMSRKAQALNPEGAYAYYTMGTAYGYLADYEIRTGKDATKTLEESIKALRLATAKDPGMETAFTNLGVSYFDQGSLASSRGEDSKPFYMNAIDAYGKALQISPQSLAPRANIANAFTNIGNDAMSRGQDPLPFYRQSIDNYEQALKINPNHWLILSNLSSVYVAQIRYELDHGKDITGTLQKIVEACEKSTKFKPGSPYAAINLADGYLIYAESVLAKGGNPLEWTGKAEKLLAAAKAADITDVYVGLAEGKQLEAEYLLSNKRDPRKELDAAAQHLAAAFKINPEELLVPTGRARVELLRADWLLLAQQSPEAALKSAEVQLAQAEKLNPRDAQCLRLRAEVDLKRCEWKASRKDPFSSELDAGLAAVQKSIGLNSDVAQTYVIRAQLLLLQASAADRAESSRIAAESVRDFERAFAINPTIQAAEKEHLAKARALIL